MFPRTRPLRWLIAALALASCAAAPAPELRVQRSSNLSHLTGTSRTIQIFLKHRYLQLLPDGTVNGTTDGNSTYTILQRVAYENRKQTTIQGVSTCLFLCMDACGFQYANKDLTDDCLFEEHYEENNYNTYSRIRGDKKTFLALDNLGKPRRTQIPINRPLANLSSYVLIMTKDCDGLKQTQCPPRRHRGKLKRPSPFHRNCQRRVKKQNLKKKKHKKPKKPHVMNKKRHPKARRKFENGTTTTTEVYDESTMSTMSTTDAEFFRSGTAQEAVGRA